MRVAIDLEAYARRIGYLQPLSPDLATVQGMVRAHAAAIAFENIDPLMGRALDLDPLALEDKLVNTGRGGYCFEHNLLMAEVLRGMGLQVTGLIARVLWKRPEDAASAQTHMLLLVTIEGERWVVDVGFGGLTLTSVLRLQAGLEQLTPHEPFRLVEREGEWRLQAQVAGQWRSLYRFTLQPTERIDYEVANHYVATHPDSPFTNNLIVARSAPDQRLALRNHEFTVHHRDGGSERYTLRSAREIRGVLEKHFMLVLPAHPALDRRLAALPE